MRATKTEEVNKQCRVRNLLFIPLGRRAKKKKKAIRWQWEIKSTESLCPKTNSQKLVNNNTRAPFTVQLLSEKILPLLIADQGATSNIRRAADDEMMRTDTHCLLQSCPVFWKIK